jgi:hypothetical protein
MTVIEHNLQQLDLLASILRQLQPAHYQQTKDWPGQPSVGKHVRHVLDHYQQLRLAIDSGLLDYRLRMRDEETEKDQVKALFWISQLKQWLGSLSAAELDNQLTYQFSESRTYTSVERELDFVASHCVHHLALIHASVEPWGYPWPEVAGVHNSTVKQHKKCAP